jgi:iron complex outermembrane recepter protein
VVIAPGSQYLGDTISHSRAWALFGHANFQVTDRFILTAGARYTKDRKDGITNTSTRGTPYVPTSIPFNYDVEVEGDNVSYLLSASYKLTPDNLVYGSYSTGYKAPGLNLNAAVSEGSSLILDSEEVENWEVGTKNTFLNGHTTLNLNLFRTKLEGLQANIAIPGRRSYLANVGDVRSVQNDALTEIPGYALVNARVGAKLGDGRYDVSAWVDNLFDKTYFQSLGATTVVVASAYGIVGRLGALRT